MIERTEQTLRDAKLNQIKSRLNNFSDLIDLDLSIEQLDFITHPLDQSCFLKACPGSGKTEVVGIKAAYEIADWKENFSGLAILSFTKNAAKEISARVAKYDSVNATQYPHFIGTIDSWLHNYILHPFAHKYARFSGVNGDKSFRLIDNEGQYIFLTPFQCRLPGTGKQIPIWINQYYLDHRGEPESQSNYVDINVLDDEQKKELKAKKKQLFKSGLTTYQDAEYLCYQTLRTIEPILLRIVSRFPIIIIDECQDLSYSQLVILYVLMQKGVKLHFIGDLNQAIYEFRKVFVENIKNFILVNKFIEKPLTINYRSNQQIVDVTSRLEAIHNKTKTVQKVLADRPLKYKNNCFVWEYDDIYDLYKKYIQIIKERDLNKQRCVILSRGKALISKLVPQSNSDYNKIELIVNALHCWNSPNRTSADKQNSIHELGKSISQLAYEGRGNHQQQYCPIGFSPIEWRYFLYELIDQASKDLFPFGDINWSNWTANLKLFLKNYWSKLPIEPTNWDKVKAVIKSPSGMAQAKVGENINRLNILSDNIRVTTIHDVKGETLDAVMLISSDEKRGQRTGRYFEDWIGLSDNPEFVRFAYVASSRPKHLLIWAIPKVQNNPYLQIIKNLGFYWE